MCTSDCSLRVNITCVLLGVFVPLPFALAHLKDGFVATTNPTIFCIGRNRDTVFYTLVLPISIFMAAGTCMMTLLFCHIIKVSPIAPWGQYHSLHLTPHPPTPHPPSYHSTPHPPHTHTILSLHPPPPHPPPPTHTHHPTTPSYHALHPPPPPPTPPHTHHPTTPPPTHPPPTSLHMQKCRRKV